MLDVFSELYHAQRWHNELKSPMLRSEIGDVFLNDFITFRHIHLGNTLGKALKFYTNLGS